MRQQQEMHDYQRFGEEHIMTHQSCCLFMGMGLGKTVTTLTAINRLMYEDFEINKVLVVAPKNVAVNVWSDEIENWEHLKHLKYSICVGTAQQRKDGLKKKVDIYIINRENVAWMVAYLEYFPFDMVVFDELSSFKNQDAIRFKVMKMVMPSVTRVVGLTGTPVGNGLIDLWAEMYLIDRGERLGKTIGSYRNEYFNPGKSKGHVVYSYVIKKDAEKIIYGKISDICISMKSEDYLKMPDLIFNTVKIKLSDKVRDQYDQFEEDQVINMLESDVEINAVTAAALRMKLLQFANGAIYDDEHIYHEVHDEKLDALGEIIEQAQGEPVLVFYEFQSDKERILKRFGGTLLKGRKEMLLWNEGKIQLMIAHPASAGHGLNLQAGGSIIVWFGLNPSLELYEQAIARLWRQGQLKPVMIYKLICIATMDVDVDYALSMKAVGQNELMNAVKALIKKHQRKVL